MESRKLIAAFVVAILVSVLCGTAAATEPQPPGPKDRCAVCGMFVEKYHPWVATIVFADGAQVFFDGPKDLFRYLFDLEKYKAQDRTIADVFVTDYYRVGFIDAKAAFFVLGSDVMGPMGGELIPLENREDAETFSLDHGGREILVFDEITRAKIPK
jgi:copper chaperone NosL